MWQKSNILDRFMKFRVEKNIRRLVLTISVVAAMIGLLLIQFNWLEESIKMQETIFSKGVNMALQQTALNMANDQELTTAMQNSIEKDSLINSEEVFTQNIISRLDSTLQRELAFYHINLDFRFILINGEDTLGLEPNARLKNGELFHQSLQAPYPDAGIDLAIHFPEKRTFILKRIGIMFATSVVLILFTMFSIFLILLYYSRERQFAKQVKDMVGNLTHEFMTPISSISLAGNMILNRSQKIGDQAIGQFATAIKEENKKLQRQVDRLLQLAAVENSGFEYQKVRLDLHEVIIDAIQSMSFQARQNDAEITTTFRAEKSIVVGDALHLTDVFLNLLSNSFKYSTERPVVAIETENLGSKIVIKVSDNGIGIPVREYKKIFEKYYRVSTGDMHNTKGVGIGLYYIKMVVKAHQGSISVKSESGKGSTFSISLPVVG